MDSNTKFEPIRIKKSRTLIPFLSFMCLVIAAASVYCALLPFIYDIEQPYNYIYTIVGGIGSVYFLIMMFSYIYTLFVPKNALIVSNEGFLDLINCGNGIGVVTWDNVEKVELCGTEEHPYIGIFIKNSDELIKSKSKKITKTILARTENEMPEIMIRPFEIDGNINDAFEIISEAFDSFGLSESNGATIAIPCDNSSKSKSDSSDFYDDANTNEFYPETEKKKQETIKEETVKEKADKEKTVDELLAELSVLLKKNPENASEETKEELDKILKSFKNNK